MVKKYYRDWKNFQESSFEFLSLNFCKSRVTFKYRNKHPSYGKLYLTNDNKSYFIKLTKRKDVDKIESYFKTILHMMANKPIEKEEKVEEKIKNEDIKEETVKEGEQEKEKVVKKDTNESNKKKQNKNKNKKSKKGKK